MFNVRSLISCYAFGMAKTQTFKQMVDQKKDLTEEVIGTPVEIVEDVADLKLGTALKRTAAVPMRMGKKVLDFFDF